MVKGLVYGCIASVFAFGTSLSIIAARHVPTIKKNAFVGELPVGGLTPEEATKRIRVWWESEKLKEFKLIASGATMPLPNETAGKLGVTVDDERTVAALPTDDLADGIKNVIDSNPPEKQTFPILFKPNGADLKWLATLVNRSMPKPHPARVIYQAGSIIRTPEVSAQQLDVQSVPQAVIKLLPTVGDLELPMKGDSKHVPDQDLKSITDVVSAFSTHFPARNRPRCSNIKLASSKIRGIVLMPGERFSFNGTVGRRTLRAGFKLAGVYKNGKHDVGIGGGICQVSTTLYNACLLGDLTIRQRSNHSLPVAYVPLGRDATVDYGDLDLVVENSYPTPIAIDSRYEPGKLTFTILGKRDPTLTVKIVRTNLRSWNPGTKQLIDRTLKPGAHHLVDKGSWGHSVSTFRFVYRSGKLIRREFLGHSNYGAHAQILAYNPNTPPQTQIAN